jgi:hypothetical protein
VGGNIGPIISGKKYQMEKKVENLKRKGRKKRGKLKLKG